MAKEKIEVELVPDVSAASKKKIADVFSLAATGGGAGKAQAFASTFGATGGQGSIAAGEAAGAGGAAAGAAAVPWIGTLIAVGGKLKDIFDGVLQFAEKTLATVTKFVAVSNPALVERLSVAFADIYGVIGESLEPVIEALIPMVQDFGDFIASIIPSADEMNGILVEMKPLWADVVSIMKYLAPTIKDMISNLVKFSEWIVWFMTKVLRMTVEEFVRGAAVVDALNQQLGGRAAGGHFERSSRGASSQQARFTGIGELGRNLQLAAASIGLSAANRTANATESMDQKMDRLNREWGGPGFAGAGGGDF